MSIFSRIFKIGQASANKVVDKFEKPELMLEQAIRDKDKQIREAKKAVQSCIATERKTKALLEKDKAEKFAWEQKAESLQPNWQSQRQAVEDLKKDIITMENELAEFKRNKDFIIAQSKAAEVKKDIYEAKAKIGNRRSADDLMARMKAKAEQQSYEADAAKEMATTFEGGDSLEKEFDNLGAAGASADVQDKLAALKAKMGQQSA